MTQANTNAAVYDINVRKADGTAITYGGGSVKVLAYLANEAGKALAELSTDTEVSVSVREGGTSLIGFTGDADTAAMVLKGKVQKVRKAARGTGTEDAPAE